MPDHFTTRLALPYPDIDDPADVPADMQQLADRLDTVVGGVTLSSLVSDVGQVNQCRAGRQLASSDFTSLGLSAPRGLWNLSDLTDASGNARSLTNKGGVGFASGVNGAAQTAAQFTGSTGQALYIADTGAADPFRITTGSWGCWFRTAKRATNQYVLCKAAAGNNNGYWLMVAAGNYLLGGVSTDGAAALQGSGTSDVCDDRWHFAVTTHDGTTVRVYVDGTLEAIANAPGTIFASAGPLDIGAAVADAGTSAGSPHFGRVDEAFVTADVLTEDQIRLLYAARLVHTLGAQPKSVNLQVRRQRKGAALATTDFSTQPVRLYNFTAGSLNDQGSNATPVTAQGTAPVSVAGADGTLGAGYSFGGAGSLAATDAGLPSALLARTYGCWFKTTATGAVGSLISWAAVNTQLLYVYQGFIRFASGADDAAGPWAADGIWHFAVAVEDNTAADGVKRKLYMDGRLVATSTVLNSLTLAGANRFRVGANSDGSSAFTGQIDSAFVCNYAMTQEEVTRIYNKATQPLASSPKNAGDHVEAFDSGSLLIIADTLEAQHYIDLTVA